MSELLQAAGSNARIIYGRESSWGTSPTAADNVYKEMGIVAGEALDENVQIYRSNQLRSDRTRNLSVRGTRRPGGNIPMELAASGPVLSLLQGLLGGSVTSSGTGPYTHWFIGTTSSTLPSFTIEKGFTDLSTPEYQAYLGGRVNSGAFGFNIDAITTAGFDFMFQQAASMSTSSVALATAVTAIPTTYPFTSVQIALTKNGVSVADVSSISMNIANNLYGDTGFILGSTMRQNLKAGSRTVGGNMTFLFADTIFYDLAMAGTLFALKITATDALSHSVEFSMPQVQLIPNGTSPKIASDGPLTINAEFEAVKDSGIGSDIKITVITSDSTIA